MYIVTKVGIMYDRPNVITEIGVGETMYEAVEILRDHYLFVNAQILTHEDAPFVIKELAMRNLRRNATLEIVAREEDGVVFVDGNGPEMDYFTITEDKFAECNA